GPALRRAVHRSRPVVTRALEGLGPARRHPDRGNRGRDHLPRRGLRDRFGPARRPAGPALAARATAPRRAPRGRVAGRLAQLWPPERLLLVGLLGGGLPCALMALAGGWQSLMVLRCLTGLFLG